MRLLTKEERVTALDRMVGDREDRLARNRRTMASFNTTNDLEIALRNAVTIAAELAELQTARAAIQGDES